MRRRRGKAYRPSPGQARTPEALALREEAIGLNPWGGYRHNLLGCEFFRMGHWELAVAELEKAVRINPWEAEFGANLARAYVAQGALDKAERAARAALARDRSSASALFALGMIDDARKDYAAAADWYRRCLDSKPSIVIRRDAAENLEIALSRIEAGRSDG